jgi:putative transposase
VRCGDVTYVRTGKPPAYYAVVPELFARKPLGRAMSFSRDSKLTVRASEKAREGGGKPVVVMFHSDEGNHHTGISGNYCGVTGSHRE